MARSYQQKRRAESQEETRQRIVEATVALHESVGVAHTTVRGIAERAGVERATVYRHFPDEHTLFAACTGHYLARNPPPDPGALARIADPAERMEAGLSSVYAYHRRTEAMTANAERDLPQFPALAAVLAPYFAHWERLRNVLVADWRIPERGGEAFEALVGHAISFRTWHSLVREQGLRDEQAVRLMAAAVGCLGRAPATTFGAGR